MQALQRELHEHARAAVPQLLCAQGGTENTGLDLSVLQLRNQAGKRQVLHESCDNNRIKLFDVTPSKGR